MPEFSGDFLASLRAAFIIVFLALYILFLGPPFILHCLITGSVDALYFIGVGGAKLALRFAGVRVRREGLENIPSAVCVFVGNHTSNADPPAVVGAIPRRVALLAKKEVFRIPIFSRALLLGGFVPVDRSNREAAISSVEKALGHLRRGLPYLIFPEGTRSPDGRLRPFKKGSFVMAIRAGVPIVPISVVGAHRIMGKGESILRSGEIVVRFHPAVETKGVALDGKDELIARVHAAVAAGLPAEQKPLGGEAAAPAPPEDGMDELSAMD